ncbi:MAG: DNA-processing protein DprA [Prevotellaceae bacterium]|jgi:DNA processing protein|nr:DNA-processing protein DprA [Prevotellaceae bacterium]
MVPEELKYYIALTLIPGVGSILAKRLIAYCGSAQTVLASPRGTLQKIPGIGAAVANEIAAQQPQALKQAEQELLFIEKNKIKTYCYSDIGYPERLRHCEDSPVVLFAKGNIDFNRIKFLSVVGTRQATPYGQMNCEKIIGQLAERGHNPVIVSGLAYGIDICAHRAALQNQLDTIAVMATGLDKIYPYSHIATARQIVEHGAWVSDFISGTALDRKNFLKRNRIIAGLSDATLIIESRIKGGALVTADIAMSYNRDVLAVPGRVGDLSSEGCNALIKQNKAALAETAADIEYTLGWERPTGNAPAKQMTLFNELSDEEKQIFVMLKERDTVGMDTLSYHTNITIGRLSALLLQLEFKGVIKNLPGKQYTLKK